MIHFPDEFPTDAVKVLAPIVRSGGVVGDKVSAGEAVLTLQAWAMGEWLGRAAAELGRTPGLLAGEVDEVMADTALLELESESLKASAAFDRKKFLQHAFDLVKFLLPLVMGA